MQDHQQTIFSVTELNRQAKQLLEQGLGVVQITGEISNWMRAGSGHCYFTLKDEQAQVRCACFRGSAMRLKFDPENGLSVILRATVSIYPNRGEYQLIVNSMEPAGLGELAIQFEKLKKKLEAEGLFADENKKRIPELPKRIGIVTSPTGAALQDMKKVLARRFPLIPIVVYPSLVQGNEAANGLQNALKQAELDNRCDVIILGRGGGSMEDLWAFNDETLARLIATFPIAVVTGIGHEVDFTIADFVADLRAATPSAAAELVVPDQQEFYDLLDNSQRVLITRMNAILDKKSAQVKHLQAKLTHPKQLLQNQMQRLDYLQQQLTTTVTQTLTTNRNRLSTLAAVLEQQSPLKLLKRGYTVLKDTADKPITSIKQARSGDKVTASLSDGSLSLLVE